MHEPRFYRQNMGERFMSLVYRYKQSDIWIAYDRDSPANKEDVLNAADEKCKSLWRIFEQYFSIDPQFRTQLEPCKAMDDAPEDIQRLSKTSFITEVGPMAGIAGLFAEQIGVYLKSKFAFKEIIVENGGDDYIDVSRDIRVSLFAGSHPLSNKIQIMIKPDMCPLGLCASSGKFGHSKSFGRADLVSIACSDPVLADQFATAYANKVKDGSEIKDVIEKALQDPRIRHIAIFKDKTFAIGGEIKVAE